MPTRTRTDARTSPENSKPAATTEVDPVAYPIHRFPTESRQLTSMLAPATLRPRRRFSLFFVIHLVVSLKFQYGRSQCRGQSIDTRPVRTSCDRNHVLRWLLPPGSKLSGCCPYQAEDDLQPLDNILTTTLSLCTHTW